MVEKRSITLTIDKCPDCRHYGYGFGRGEDYCKVSGEEIVHRTMIPTVCPLLPENKMEAT